MSRKSWQKGADKNKKTAENIMHKIYKTICGLMIDLRLSDSSHYILVEGVADYVKMTCRTG